MTMTEEKAVDRVEEIKQLLIHNPLNLSACHNAIQWLLSQLAAKEKADPQTDSPILKIFVEEDGSISACDFYAPGLPPGEHDLWCVPVQIKR